MKAWVEHGYYGCETGCCGHTVHFDSKDQYSVFGFNHPYQDDQDKRQAWAERLVEAVAAERGIKEPVEIDWTRCSISGD